MPFLDESGLETVLSGLWDKTIGYINQRPAGNQNAFLVKAPVGTIVIWSGTAEDIPTGWQLCDGTNGTPDLRDKFVLGAGEDHPVGETGGSEEVTLTVEQMPEHTHKNYYLVDWGARGNDLSVPGRRDGATGTTDWTKETGGSQPNSNMPPYYSLCYIMKLIPDQNDGLGLIPITEEEYDALSEEERSGKPYLVTDANTPNPSPITWKTNAPLGTIISFLGVNAPEGYLACDGTVYKISRYPLLAQFFADQFGEANHFGGDGTTTFAVPDMRNLFLRGYHGDAEEELSGPIGEKQEATEHYGIRPQVEGTSADVTFSYNGDISSPYVNWEERKPDTLILGQQRGSVGSKTVPQSNTWNNGWLYTSRPVNMAVLYCIKAIPDTSEITLDEYDTDDGWHVRKWSDGYVEMDLVEEFDNVSFVSFPGGHAATLRTNPVNLPVVLTGLYSFQSCIVKNTSNAGFFLLYLTTDHNPLTQIPGRMGINTSYTGNTPPANFCISTTVAGRWK